MGAVRLRAEWVVAFDGAGHRLLQAGEVVFEGSTIVFVGRGYDGPLALDLDLGQAVIGPGFIDLNALFDLDSTVLGFDNQPDHLHGRVWPRSYLERGPREVYTADEQDFGRYYAMVQLILNGITTAQPIASLLYRAWAESADEFTRIADMAGGLGLRAYLGPAYMTGLTYTDEAGSPRRHFDEARGLAGLEEARQFVREVDGRHGGLIRGMLAPDRIETCTPELLRRTRDAARELGCPVRLHCCQSAYEFAAVREQHGMTPIEWLASLDFLGPRVMLPHGIHLSGTPYTDVPGTSDQELLAASGATLVTCPIVAARYGEAMTSFKRFRKMGINIAFGTDTWPPDMVANLREAVHLCRVVERRSDALSTAEVYTAATLGAAKALGRDDLGRLCPGAKADIAAFRLDRPELGPLVDPLQSLLIAGSGRDCCLTVIDGRIVMQDRQIPGVDLEVLRRRAQAQYDKLRSTYPERTPGHPPVEAIFRPTFEAMP